MSLIVFLEWALLGWLFAGRSSARAAFARASAVWGALILLSTEGFSFFGLLRFGPLLCFWVLASIATAAWIWRKRVILPVGMPAFPLRAPVISSSILILLVGFLSPPNTWDSMTYHMSRVTHWIQNGHVGFYPTHIERQLFLSPWAEYAILQLQILDGGSDRAAGSVQGMALIGAMVLASALVGCLKFNKLSQGIAALLVISTPMIILQGSSTQNDLVCAWWVLMAVYFLLESSTGSRPGQGWDSNSLFAAISMALAISTKGTAYVFLAPFVIFHLSWRLRRVRSSRLLGEAALFVSVVALLNGPFWARNQRFYGHPLGNQAVLESIDNQTFEPRHFTLNLVRNTTLHMATPWVAINQKIEEAVRELATALDLDVNDPAITYHHDYAVAPMINHEDYASNGVASLLFVLSFLVYLSRSRNHERVRPVLVFSALCLAGFMLFSLLFRWQPWHSRLHTPYFALAAVCTAPVFEILGLHSRTTTAVALAIWSASLPWLFLNRSRALLTLPRAGAVSLLSLSREQRAFTNRPELHPVFDEAMAKLAHLRCDEVGLVTESDSWEYAAHSMARSRGMRVHWTHWWVDRTGVLQSPGSAAPLPCALLSMDTRIEVDEPPEFAYTVHWQRFPVTLWIPGKHP